MFEIAEAKAAPLFLDCDAMQAKRAHGGPELVAREPVLRVDARGEGSDAIGGETGGGVADHVGIVAEREIEIGRHEPLLAA